MAIGTPVLAEMNVINQGKAPGMGAFEEGPKQKSDTVATWKIRHPSFDADGTSLSGLKRAKVATKAFSPDGQHPFTNMGGSDIEASDAVVVTVQLTDADAGLTTSGESPVLASSGAKQGFALWFEDDE